MKHLKIFEAFTTESDIPNEVLKKVNILLDKLTSNRTCGDSDVVDGWFIETHTLGCRYEAGTLEEDWWDEHWEIYDEYNDDENSYVLGDPADGIFVTITKPKI